MHGWAGECTRTHSMQRMGVRSLQPHTHENNMFCKLYRLVALLSMSTFMANCTKSGPVKTCLTPRCATSRLTTKPSTSARFANAPVCIMRSIHMHKHLLSKILPARLYLPAFPAHMAHIGTYPTHIEANKFERISLTQKLQALPEDVSHNQVFSNRTRPKMNHTTRPGQNHPTPAQLSPSTDV